MVTSSGSWIVGATSKAGDGGLGVRETGRRGGGGSGGDTGVAGAGGVVTGGMVRLEDEEVEGEGAESGGEADIGEYVELGEEEKSEGDE